MTSSNRKPMLATSQLIKTMKSKGIVFNKVSTTKARQILEHDNYYFELSLYADNFPKIKGQYQNLDFAYLVDVSSLDFHLREYLMQLCLDIEHRIKVKLMALIANDPREDGYSIVQDFGRQNKFEYGKTMDHLKKSQYLQDLFQPRSDQVSIWLFFEGTTFGTLVLFVDFYTKRTSSKVTRQIHNYLQYAKNIRNACAHNNPILVNLFSDKTFLRKPAAPIRTAARTLGISSQYLHDWKINDLVSLFYLHKLLRSQPLDVHRRQTGDYLIERFNKHRDWYSDNVNMNTFKQILTVLIDYINNH